MNTNFRRSASGAMIFAGLISVLAGCNSGGSSSSPLPRPTPTPTPSGCGPVVKNSRVFVTNGSGAVSTNPNTPDTIDVFTISSILTPSGSTINPCAQISSSGFTSALSIAVDSAGNIYVPDLATSKILVFAVGANGTSVAPIRTITGTSTAPLSSPLGVAVDSSGKLYVSLDGVTASSAPPGAVYVYAAGANGPSTPTRIIAGPTTTLSIPTGIAVDLAGNIYVANNGTSSSPINTVAVFGPSATGAPSRIIQGPTSGLNVPFGVTVSGGFVYVANRGTVTSSTVPGTVTVYTAGTTGSSTPVRTISSGSSTGLFGPTGVAVDPSGNLWVAENGPVSTSVPSGVLAAYPPGATGAVPPKASVFGVGTAAWGVATF